MNSKQNGQFYLLFTYVTTHELGSFLGDQSKISSLQDERFYIFQTAYHGPLTTLSRGANMSCQITEASHYAGLPTLVPAP